MPETAQEKTIRLINELDTKVGKNKEEWLGMRAEDKQEVENMKADLEKIRTEQAKAEQLDDLQGSVADLQRQIDKMDGRSQLGTSVVGRDGKIRRSVGRAFVENEQVKNDLVVNKGNRTSGRFDYYSALTNTDALKETLEIMDLDECPLEGACFVIGIPRIDARGYGNIQVTTRTLFDNQAAGTALGAVKPESNFAWGVKTYTFRTIAHWVPVHNQCLSQSAILADEIDNVLVVGLNQRVDFEAAYGSGTPQLDGLWGNVPGVTTAPIAGDTRIDRVRNALKQILSAHGMLSGVRLKTHPDDFFAMLGTKDANGNYLAGSPFHCSDDLSYCVYGAPVDWCNMLTPTHFFMADWAQATRLYDNIDLKVDVGWVNQQFIQNMQTVRAEQTLTLATRCIDQIVADVF